MKENRNIIIRVRLTEEEKNQFIQLSKKDDKSISSIIRESVLKAKTVSKTDIQTVYELKKIGANLNQIAKHLNMLPVEENIREYLVSIQNHLDKIKLIENNLL